MKRGLRLALALLMLAGCKNGTAKNKLLGGVPLQLDGQTKVNTGTIQARKDETIEQNVALLRQLGQYGQLASSFGSGGFIAPRPAPSAVIGAETFDPATGFYVLDTGDPNFVFKSRYNDSAGLPLQVIENPLLEPLVKSVRTVVTFGFPGVESFSFDLTFTFANVGDPEGPQTMTGTIGGSSFIEFEDGSAPVSSTFSASFANFSTDYDDVTGNFTQNGTVEFVSTYPGGALFETTTYTNFLIDSNQLFVSGRIDTAGETGGEAFSGAIVFTGGVGTGTFVFGSETVTVQLNADGTGSYTDSTGTHPLAA